ncbi:MFS transporter [Cellulomonas sp. C5510]|uniref:MFS transporter n=1 Tax=Cellulomonas sp. C5510 TaxID=2871170 RepID=UPI001C94F5CF|nr:MFS transporter [Cellulomonas sp. C5510]QZN84201.1 MFS transporter [Cellulomonas sp. C5510]
MLLVLRDRAYRRLFASQVVSLTGTGLATVALGLLAYDLAGGRAGVVLGTVFALKMLAYVAVAPVAAAVVHRLPSRAVLVGADVVRVVVVLGLPLVSSVAQVYALVLVLQAASAVHTPAYQAVVPRLVPDELRYTQALSLSRLAEDLEMLLSPVLAAALLLVLPGQQLFLGTAAGFAVSAAVISRTRIPAGTAAAVQDADLPFGARVRRGAVLMVRTPALRAVLALDLAVASAGAFALVQYVAVARDAFGGGARAAALLLAALGAGSLTVAVLLPCVLARRPERAVVLGGVGALTLGTAAVAAGLTIRGTAGLAVVGALFALVGAGWAAAETPVGRVVARSVGQGEQPAVFAAQFSLSHACWLVTYPLAGALGTFGPGVAALALAGLAAVAGTATAALWPRPASLTAVVAG